MSTGAARGAKRKERSTPSSSCPREVEEAIGQIFDPRLKSARAKDVLAALKRASSTFLILPHVVVPR